MPAPSLSLHGQRIHADRSTKSEQGPDHQIQRHSGRPGLNLGKAGLARAEHPGYLRLSQVLLLTPLANNSTDRSANLNELTLFSAELEEILGITDDPTGRLESLALFPVHRSAFLTASSYAFSRCWHLLISFSLVSLVVLENTAAIIIASGSIR